MGLFGRSVERRNRETIQRGAAEGRASTAGNLLGMGAGAKPLRQFRGQRRDEWKSRMRDIKSEFRRREVDVERDLRDQKREIWKEMRIEDFEDRVRALRGRKEYRDDLRQAERQLRDVTKEATREYKKIHDQQRKALNRSRREQKRETESQLQKKYSGLRKQLREAQMDYERRQSQSQTLATPPSLSSPNARGRGAPGQPMRRLGERDERPTYTTAA